MARLPQPPGGRSEVDTTEVTSVTVTGGFTTTEFIVTHVAVGALVRHPVQN